MVHALISVDEDGNAMCPDCKSTGGIHFNDVDVLTASGRSIRAVPSGEDDRSTVSIEPLSIRDTGRRHSIVLHWDCELCKPGRGTISIQQHKGMSPTLTARE